MAAISAWPSILSVVEGDYKGKSFKSGAAINRGAVCSLDSSNRAIPQPITGTPSAIIGVALEGAAAAGEDVTIVYSGVCRVANATDGAIAVGATVKVGTYAGAAVATTTFTDTQIFGQVVDSAGIPASGSGLVLLKLR